MAETGALVIDWTQMPTYNTIMAVAAGAALLSLVSLGRRVLAGRALHPEGWALNFAATGVLLTITGAHMTLTWPFAKYFPFDNIIFGEPSLAFGVLLLAAAALFWRRAEALRSGEGVVAELAAAARPLEFLIFGLGLSLVAIACAGIAFQLFAAPPEEPISGRFAAYPWFEATVISGLYALTGLSALLFPFVLRGAETARPSGGLTRLLGWLMTLGGLFLLLFGALNYYTHIGLIIHTMPK